MKTKQCTICKEFKPLSAYRKAAVVKNPCNDIITKEYRAATCKNCESKERREHIWDIKAYNTLRTHTKRFRFTLEELASWGVTKEYVKFLFLREWTLYEAGMHSCLNCFPEQCDHKFKDAFGKPVTRPMTPGDFTLDVIDKSRVKTTKMLTRSNLRVICKTANLAKGVKDPTPHDIDVEESYRDVKTIRGGVQFDLPTPTRSSGLVWQHSHASKVSTKTPQLALF